MLISVIIPVYNAEKFLSKCLDSVKNQTYQDLEIILVNDGSTDKSGLICDEYSRKDQRFIVIHKKNGGVSSARNAALKIAKGDYIGFVDPDDWVEPNMFEKLYQLIIDYKADISMCGYVKEKLDGTILNNIVKPDIIKMDRKEALNKILNSNSFKGFLWNKLFSANLIKNNQITFDESIHFCEDLLYCCQCIVKSKNIVYDTTPYYHYVIHDSNASKSNYSSKKLTSLDALVKIIDILNNENEGDIELKKYKNYYMHMNISLLMNGIHDKKYKSEDYKQLKENLFRYKIGDLTEKSIKLSCVIGRINIHLLYFIWKTSKKLIQINN
ncbi:glycosyltransferase [Bacillus smithii]|uniref:glycosyltransferase n=1 Tax=Bacillus smithii TaxID=1479 RepID=UPI003D24C2EB